MSPASLYGPRSRGVGTARLLSLLTAAALIAVWLAVPAQRASAATCPGGVINVVAHEDDDLIFINPDIQADIDAGRCVRTVFVTAGDAGSPMPGALSREAGPEAAYAYMAGVANSWTTSDAGVAGRSITLRTLTGRPNVSLVFMRLPDGSPSGTGYSAFTNQSLRKLWTGELPSITTVDGAQSYTQAGLVGTLAELLTDFGPSTIRTQDYVLPYGDHDHSDHLTVGPLVKAATAQYVAQYQLLAYQGYGSGSQPQNVFGTELTRKQAALSAYSIVDQGVVGNSWVDNLVKRKIILDTTNSTGGTPVNRPPAANAGPDQSVNGGSTVVLNGTGSADPDGNAITYQWTQTGGPTVTLSSAISASPTFQAPTTSEVLTFSLVVSDGQLTSTADTVTIQVASVSGNNLARSLSPTVTASSQNTTDGQTAAKAVDGSPLGYPTDSSREWVTVGERAGAWLQLDWSAPVTVDRVVLYDRPNLVDWITGATLTFSDGTTTTVPSLNNDGSALAITIPPKATTSIRMTVSTVASGTSNVGLAEMEVWGQNGGTVGPPPNRAPVANAGADQSVNIGSAATLNGTASSDPDGDPLTYAWTQTGGTTVALSSATAASPTFTAPSAPGPLVFSLVVSDGALSSTADTVSIDVVDGSAVNMARTGSPTVTASSQNTTDGQTAAKAVDGSPLGYPTDYTREWASVGQRAGAWLQLDWSTPVTLSSVVLYDRPNTSDWITGATLSFSDGSTVTTGSLNNNGSATRVTFSPRATTSLRMTVNTVAASTANVGLAEIEAWGTSGGTLNRAPAANAGPDQNVNAGSTVTLNGTASSDPDGNPLTYAWTQTGGATVALSSTTAASPTFTAPAAAGTLTFSLTVNDGTVASAADTVAINVAVPNRAPVANAGADQNVTTGSTVTLNGTASSDPDGNPLTYAWTQTGGATVALSSTTAASPTFTAPAAAGTLTFSLTVNDGSLTSPADTVAVNVSTPLPAPTGLTATATGSGIRLDWADSPAGTTGYNVYRSTAATGTYTRVNATPTTVSAWEDTTAPSGQSFYRVTAIGSGGAESAQSTAASATMATAELLANASFELDANADTRPDSWTSSSRFTRQAGSARSGTYGGQLLTTTDTNFTISQTRTGLTAGRSYSMAGWVNIPATTDAFTFTVRIRWLNSSGTLISTQNVATYSTGTAGWVKAAGTYTSPALTARAVVDLVSTSVRGTINVDDFSLR